MQNNHSNNLKSLLMAINIYDAVILLSPSKIPSAEISVVTNICETLIIIAKQKVMS